jgi:hypothetical protein
MFEKLKGLLGLSTPTEPVNTELVYIVLPEPLMPLDRGDKYEDPLDVELKLGNLGYISGGGSSLGEEDEDGNRSIEWCGIDVDTTDVMRARQLLREHLPALGCLVDTQLYYYINDIPLLDRYDGQEWVLEQPREQLHPGFGI